VETSSEEAADLTDCWSCGSDSVEREWQAEERMFGWGGEFTYLECAQCRSLRIQEVPADLARYYPEDYYSLRQVDLDRGVKAAVRRRRNRHALGRKSILGGFATKVFGPPDFSGSLGIAHVEACSKILDVGAGAGHLVYHLAEAGFTRVAGLEPHIDADLTFPNGAVVHKSTLADFDDTWNLILSHHSFEHIPDPLDALREMHRLLEPQGVVLLRLPVAGTFAWHTYGTRWVQLDAPRHLTLHTELSITALSDSAGFNIENVVYDSTAFQFWGSELYLRDIPLVEADTYAKMHDMAPANKARMRAYTERAEELNKIQQGDQAAFYLRKRS
jgi:SAM-dependent methyltransferase